MPTAPTLTPPPACSYSISLSGRANAEGPLSFEGENWSIYDDIRRNIRKITNIKTVSMNTRNLSFSLHHNIFNMHKRNPLLR
jgi:hypothetical protein